MKPVLILAILPIIFTAFLLRSDFLTDQKKFARVRSSILEKEKLIEQLLKKNNLGINNFDLLITAYKDQDELELYAKEKQETVFRSIKSYKICSRSGKLGPKRKEGDQQVPEGFYHIDRFNPTSDFYLSLGLNYPNQADRKKSKATQLGGDIFIHGACVTIGCLPMTNDRIKEIYLIAVHARNNGQLKIPVYIFPFKMTDSNFKIYEEQFKENKELVSFWTNLKIGFDKFRDDKKELKIRISENGDYQF